MQEIIHIQLVNKTLQAIITNDENKLQYIGDELEQHERAIDNLIMSYYFMERKWVYNVVIKVSSIQIDRSGMGSFAVDYMLGASNAGANTDRNEQARMMILMKVNFDTQSMVLTGEDIP